MAREGEPDGIRCNVVLPSVIDTPANRAATPPERHGKLAPPAEIAAVIRFLCSEESARDQRGRGAVYGTP